MTHAPRNDSEALRITNAAAVFCDRMNKVPGGIVGLWARVRAEDASPIRAASYGDETERVRRKGYDEHGALPDYSDPTGNAGVASSDLPELKRGLQSIADGLAIVEALETRYMRDKPGPPLPLEGPGDIWCRSCWRVHVAGDNAREPIADRYKGKRLCNWCGEWVADQHKAHELEGSTLLLGSDGLPPKELVAIRLGRDPHKLYEAEVLRYRMSMVEVA